MDGGAVDEISGMRVLLHLHGGFAFLARQQRLDFVDVKALGRLAGQSAGPGGDAVGEFGDAKRVELAHCRVEMEEFTVKILDQRLEEMGPVLGICNDALERLGVVPPT